MGYGEPIGTAKVTEIRRNRQDAISIGLIAAAALEVGQMVKITADRTVNVLAAGTDVPVGIVEVRADAGQEATVSLFCHCQHDNAFAKGGAIAAGALVRQDGTIHASGGKNYVAAAAGTYASGVVVLGGASGAAITVFVFNQPIVVPA